jgi:hypothetical protein
VLAATRGSRMAPSPVTRMQTFHHI